MKKTISLLIALLISSTAFAQNFEGKWSGSLEIMGQKLPIVFNISQKDTTFITKMDSPAQNALGLPTNKTIVDGNELEIIASGLGIHYKGTLESDSIVGFFNQNGLSLSLTLRQSQEPDFIRPQQPQPPYPYRIEEVVITNKKNNNSISATITTPDNIEKHPAVILVAGSGPNDRDETVFGHKPFWVIADHLTRNGIIVLRYDKRGVGKSTGKYETATTSDFAEDAQTAIDYLISRRDVDKTSIGIIGHSEGGIIAPMIASKRNDIKHIILLAGMGTKGIDLIMQQNKLALEDQNIEPQNVEELLSITRNTLESIHHWQGTENDKTALRDKINSLWDKTPLIQRMKLNKDQYIRSNFIAMSSPWFREFIKIDPSSYIKRVKCPVLVLNGENDMQVIAKDNTELIEVALTQGKNKNYKIKLYPHLNHLFQESETGKVDEYIKIEQTISDQVLNDITEWIKINSITP